MRFLIMLILCLFISLSFYQCAGTREDDQNASKTEDDKQKKELDDIEALLGISSSQDQAKQDQAGLDKKQDQQQQQTKAKEQPKKTDEKLSLLEGNESLGGQSDQPVTDPERKKYEDKINKLENQIKQKDQTISDLNTQLSDQESKSRSYSPSYSSTPVGDVSIADYHSRYDDARAAFESRNYNNAIELFESLLATSTTQSLSDNAQYWIGESHYQLGQYDAAIIDFEKVLTFPNSNKLDDAQYKLGLCYIRKGDKKKAQEELGRLLNDYPQSEYIGKAKSQLAKL